MSTCLRSLLLARLKLSTRVEWAPPPESTSWVPKLSVLLLWRFRSGRWKYVISNEALAEDRA